MMFFEKPYWCYKKTTFYTVTGKVILINFRLIILAQVM